MRLLPLHFVVCADFELWYSHYLTFSSIYVASIRVSSDAQAKML